MRQRNKKLIKRGLQLKMIAVFVALACISGCFQVILVNRSVTEIMQEAQLGEGALADRLPGIVAENLVWTLVLLVPLMAYIGLVVTNRVAGPIYVFERYLDRLLAGERVGVCRLRRTDELGELADRLSQLAERLQAGADAAPGPRPADGGPSDDPTGTDASLERAA